MRAAQVRWLEEIFIHVWINNDSLHYTLSQKTSSDIMHTVVSVEKINAGKLHLCDAVKLKDQLHLGYFRKKKKRSAHSTWTSHTAPNTTQSSLTTVRLFQSGLSSLKLSPCLWQLGRLCFSAFKKEKKKTQNIHIPVSSLFHWPQSIWPLQLKSSNLCHRLSTSHRWQAGAILWAQNAPSAKKSHQKFAEELPERMKKTDECRGSVYLTWVAMHEKWHPRSINAHIV